MGKNIKTEQDIKNALKINKWSELSRDKVLKLVQMTPDIDKEVYIKIIEQVPHL